MESATLPPGLNEDVIRHISAKKEEPEWLLDWRLKAFRHWQTMDEPRWPHVQYEPIDYQGISYYSAPGAKDKDRPKSWYSARALNRLRKKSLKEQSEPKRKKNIQEAKEPKRKRGD